MGQQLTANLMRSEGFTEMPKIRERKSDKGKGRTKCTRVHGWKCDTGKFPNSAVSPFLSLTNSLLSARRYASSGTSHDPVSSICLSVCLSVCVCLSQVGVLSKRMNESSWLLAWELPIIYPTNFLKENSGISKNKGTSLWNFVPNSSLRKVCFGTSIVKNVLST